MPGHITDAGKALFFGAFDGNACFNCHCFWIGLSYDGTLIAPPKRMDGVRYDVSNGAIYCSPVKWHKSTFEANGYEVFYYEHTGRYRRNLHIIHGEFPSARCVDGTFTLDWSEDPLIRLHGDGTGAKPLAEGRDERLVDALETLWELQR